MPPQDVTNNSAPASPVPPVNPTPTSPNPISPMDSLMKNKKFMDTVKAFAIYGAIVSVVNSAVDMVISVFHFSGIYNSISITGLIGALIMGAVGGIIGGALFFFFFEPAHNWIKTNAFLSHYIHDVFTLFWKPSLVGIVISAALGLLSILGLGGVAVGLYAGYAVAGIASLFVGWVIVLIVHVAVYYFYAKSISSKISSYYPW